MRKRHFVPRYYESILRVAVCTRLVEYEISGCTCFCLQSIYEVLVDFFKVLQT